MADVCHRSDDLTHLRAGVRDLHTHIIDSRQKIVENCLPNIALRLCSKKLKLIHHCVPVGDGISEPAQRQHQVFSRHRRLNRMRNLRQLQIWPVSGDEPAASAGTHLKQGICTACSTLEIDQIPLEIKSCELLCYPLLTPFQCVGQEHRKESCEGCRPSSNRRDCIPPDYAIVDAQRTATKNSIKPCHSLIPLCTGRHSAMQMRPEEIAHG